jgi:hypothetical protein
MLRSLVGRIGTLSPINLIPPDVVSRRRTRIRVLQWEKRLGLSVVLAGMLYLGLVDLARHRNAEVRAVMTRYEVLRQRLQDAEGTLAERDRLAERFDVISSVRGRLTPGAYLEIIGDALPPGAYLSLVEFGPPSGETSESGTSPEGAETDQLRIRGQASGQQDVGQVLRRLIGSGRFDEVNLVSVADIADPLVGQHVEFEILCRPTLKGAGSQGAGS